jgi:hypothetical protein
VEVLNARVDCHPVVQFRIERNLVFQGSWKLALSVRMKSGRSVGDERMRDTHCQ